MTELDIKASQHTLLNTHRQTLQMLLKQEAQFGGAYTPPALIHSIYQARSEIAKIKSFLRSNGEHIVDLPGEAEQDEVGAQPSLSESIYNGIDAIIKMLPLPAVRESAMKFRIVFEQTSRQIQVINFYKKLHDEFQELELLVNRLEDDCRQIERMLVEWDDLTIFEEIQEKIQDLHAIALRALYDSESQRWIQQLDQITAILRTAVAQTDNTQLKGVVRRLYSLFNSVPTRINTRLVSAAENLLLTELIPALIEVHEHLSHIRFDLIAAQHIETSIGALTTLNTTLQQSVRNHQQWQDIDDELRRVEANLSSDIQELEVAWPDLQIMAVSIYGNNSAEWALTLAQTWSDLENALTSRIFDKVRPHFRKYRRKASRRFRQVDDELLGLCNELQNIGASLNLLLRALE